VVYDNIPKPPELPDGWTARFIRPNEEEAVLGVLFKAFERWPKLAVSVTPLEHLRWKMSCHPLAQQFHIVVESPDGIVGARLEWAFETKVNDRVITMREPVDRAVMPEFQHNYAMSAMRVYAQELRDKSFDMYMGYGSDTPGLRNLRRYRVPSARFSRTIDVLVCDPELVENAEESTTSWTVRAVDSFDERADTLWSKAQSQFLFGIVRSSAHLNWRYADPRAGDYVVLAAEEDRCWLGYVVLRAADNAGYIADLLALPDRLDVAESLLAAAVAHFRAAGQRRVECWSSGYSVYRWAQDRTGFNRLRRTIDIVYRPTRVSPEDVAFLKDPKASVHITAGDTDLV
jgi:hypothetical protein